MQQNNSIKTNSFTKVLDLNLNTSLVSEDTVIHARNSIMFSQQGDLIFYQNEQANRKVTDIPYPCIGHEKLPDGTFVLFLTDNIKKRWHK